MPDTLTPGAPPRGRQFAGQPWWIWAAGGVALVGGYIYLRSRGKTSGAQPAAATSTTAAGSPTGLSWEQFLLFIHDQQAPPRPAAAPKKPPPKPKPKPKPRPRRVSR